MKLKLNHIIGFVGTVLLVSCFGGKEVSKRSQEIDTSILETQYYRAFTDATKHALFGNNKSAIALYEACIAEFPDRAASYYQLSSIYLRQNEFDKAVSYSRKACEKDTLNAWYKVHLANIYQYLGRVDSAIILYEDLIGDSRDGDEMRYNLAMLYSQAQRNDEAIRTLEGISEENRDSREILLMKHNAFHSMMEYDSAVFILEDIIKLFPEDITNYGMLAEYLTEIGRNNYAKKVYHEILKSDSTNGLAMLSFAEHFVKENNIDSAFVCYNLAFCCSDLALDEKISVIITFMNNEDFLVQNEERILSLLDNIDFKDKGFSYYAARSDIYINLEKFDKAKPYLDSALLFEHTNYMVWEQTLLVNSLLNDDKEIIRIAGEAMNYFSDKPNLYLIRANSYTNLESYNLAIADLEFVQTMNLSELQRIQAYNLLAEVYRATKEFSKSDAYYEKILEIDEMNLAIRNNYAYYLSLREENLSRAEELSNYTIMVDPDNPTYLDTYGWILFKMGKFLEAKKYIESAIRNGSYNNTEVLEHYGDVMFKLDRCDEAIEAYQTVLELDSTSNVKSKIEEVHATCK